MSMKLERKTQKVLDLLVDGMNLVCVFHYDEKVNPYHLYLEWYDGRMHRKQIVRYGNLISVIDHIRTWMINNNKGFKDVF